MTAAMAVVLDAACRHTLDQVGALVRVWTPRDGVIFVNRAWREFTGTTGEENAGDRWMQCVVEEDRAIVKEIGGAGAAPLEYRLRTHDGRTLLVTDSPGAWTTGDGLDAVGVIHTVVPRPEAVADDDRSKTMSKWAHELRGPLNAILGWSDLLSAGETADDVVQRGLKAIASNARQQAQIIKRMAE